MKAIERKRIAKLMQHSWLLAEEALGIFEDSNSKDGELEHELHELMNAAHHIENLMNGSVKHTKMGCV